MTAKSIIKELHAALDAGDLDAANSTIETAILCCPHEEMLLVADECSRLADYDEYTDVPDGFGLN